MRFFLNRHLLQRTFNIAKTIEEVLVKAVFGIVEIEALVELHKHLVFRHVRASGHLPRATSNIPKTRIYPVS